MSSVRGGLFVVSAPSGAGKTSLTRALITRLAGIGIPAAISVSYTTRPPRPGEENGRHYHFVSAKVFAGMVRNGDFLEHAEVFGHRYGTGRAATEAQLAAGTDLILDIDWQGGRQIRKADPAALGVFILPPSLAELERRLRERRQDPDEVVARRMAEAREEMSHHAEYDYLIINDHFDRALAELAAIVRARRLGREGQLKRHKRLISKLLA